MGCECRADVGKLLARTKQSSAPSSCCSGCRKFTHLHRRPSSENQFSFVASSAPLVHSSISRELCDSLLLWTRTMAFTEGMCLCRRGHRTPWTVSYL